MSESSRKGFLLDTNIVIGLFAAAEDLKWQVAHDAQYSLPCIVVGELLYGAYCSRDVHENLLEIQTLIESSQVIVCDALTGHYFGRIKADLKAQGKLIPDNDIWIAAVALQHELTLVTRDSHFELIQGLSLERW